MTIDTKKPHSIFKDRFENQSRFVGEKLLNEQHKEPRNLLATTHIGNEHISIPAFLIADPILEPVDKAVYNAIRLVTPKQISGEQTAYPNYRDICRVANISSDATVSRALIILRMMRWISQRTLSATSGVLGNVYMTHDHPLDFAMFIEINSTYDELLRSSLHHNHARVRAVAEVVIESYENDLVKTDAPLHTLEQVTVSSDYLQGVKDGEYFSISSKSIDNLNSSSKFKEPYIASSLNIKEPKISSPLNIKEHSTLNIKEPAKSPSLNIKEGDLLGSLNIEEPSSSGSRNIITTTTKAGNLHLSKQPDIKLMNEISEMFSDMQSDQHRQIGRLVMRCELEEDRYSAVYELSNRLKYGKTPIHNPIGYLGKLIGMLNAGDYPFSSFAQKNFSNVQTKNPQQKARTADQELNEVRFELNNIINEIRALEKMQEQMPNELFEKQITQFKQQAHELSDKKIQLEQDKQSQGFRN